MPRIALVRHTWTKSPSADVVKVVSLLTIDGTETRTEYPPETEEFTTDVRAGSSVQFRIDTFDSEGNVATSSTHAYSLGDLMLPLPATNLSHEVLSVRDEEAPPGGLARSQQKSEKKSEKKAQE